MFLPMGFSLPKRFLATVGPMTATRWRLSLSVCEMKVPTVSVSERIAIYSGVTPMTTVFQF